MPFETGESLPWLVTEINERNAAATPGDTLVFHGHLARISNLIASSATAAIVLTRVTERLAVGTAV